MNNDVTIIGGYRCTQKRKNFSEETGDFITGRVEYEQPSNYIEKEKAFTDEELRLIDEDRTFSAGMVKTRLKVMNLAPKVRLARIVKDYKLFYKGSSKSMTAEQMNQAQELFVSDVMGVFNSVVENVINGSNLVSLLGLTMYDKSVADAGRKLSIVYGKSLKLERATGDVPATLYRQLSELFEIFFTKLKEEVFMTKNTNANFNNLNVK